MKNMMRKYLLLVVTAFVLCGCQGRVVSTDKVDAETAVNQKPDAEAVADRVQEIYSVVFKEYNLEDSLRNLDQLEGMGAYGHRGEFMQNFCSQEWNRLSRQIHEIDSLHHSGELGFWSADYWIMGQDWHNLSISDVEVLAVTPAEAAVLLQLHNFDSSKPVALRLVLEDGEWKIDDFQDVENGLDWKQSMQEYVNQETARNKN